MIGNDTYALALDSGYFQGAALALAVYTPIAGQRRPRQRGRKVNPTPPCERLAARVVVLWGVIEQARTALRAGRVNEALQTLEKAGIA